MVNIRATLAMAERSNILGAAARESLERRAKELFFGERRWQTLLTLAPGIGVPAHERQALTAWLPGGHVDQKRLDALAMLNAMRNSNGERALGAAFQFDWTFLWDEFVGRSSDAAENPLTSGERILEELRLLGPEAYHRVEVSALLRAAAVDGARGNPISGDDRREWLVRFRAGRALFARADLDRWMAHNDLTPAAFETMIDAQAGLVALRRRLGRSLDRYVLDELRLIGDYPALADRARRKNEAAMAADRADLLPQVATAAHLRLWYFEQRLHRSVPDDFSAYSSDIGFADAAAFDRALYRERVFLDQLPGQP
jgi:hypothetical protein